MDTKVLFKYRSVIACMKASYDLVSSNITSLLKKTWWASLIFAIFMALTVYFRMPNKALHDWGELNPWASYILQSIIYLCTWLSTMVAGAAIWSWINKRPYLRNLVRFFMIGVIFDILTLLCNLLLSDGVLAYFTSSAAKAMKANAPMTTTYVVTALLIVAVVIISLIILLPFCHVIPKVMLMETNEKLEPWKTYKTGLSSMGSIFKMSFLGIILLGILSTLVLTPSIILGWANMSSQLGALGGDPLGVPSYFNLLFIIVLIITFFILAYMGSWLGISYAYLFGSKKIQEEERRKALGNDDKENIANI